MRRKLSHRIAAACMAVLLAGSMIGCNKNEETQKRTGVENQEGTDSTNKDTNSTGETDSTDKDTNSTGGNESIGNGTTILPSGGEGEAAQIELPTVSTEETVKAKITLSDSGIVIDGKGCEADGTELKIKKSGTYEISGEMSEGRIKITADEDSEVHLIFQGVTLHCEKDSVVQCKTAAQVTITLADGTDNKLSNGIGYDEEKGETEASAALTAKCNLIVTGNGTLTISSPNATALKCKEELYLLSGTYRITSGEDALHSDHTMVIAGGTYEISAGDDGVHADDELTITGDPVININKCYEGLESAKITISGGTIYIEASDDGINAAKKSESTEGNGGFGNFGGKNMGQKGGFGGFGGGFGQADSSVLLNITGGMITVNAIGDGLDSNGNITMSGGTVLVYGPVADMNGALDYDGTFVITGGSLLAIGSSGMAQTVSETSTQYAVAAVLNQNATAGSTVTIRLGTETVFETTAVRSFKYVTASCSDMTKGETVSVLINGKETYSDQMEQVVTVFGNMSGGFGGGMGNFGGGRGQGGNGFQRPDGSNGDGFQMPDGSDGNGFQMPDGSNGNGFNGYQRPGEDSSNWQDKKNDKRSGQDSGTDL